MIEGLVSFFVIRTLFCSKKKQPKVMHEGPGKFDIKSATFLASVLVPNLLMLNLSLVSPGVVHIPISLYNLEPK